MADYPIFMAIVERVGHDKRGNPLFKRDRHGNEILVPDIDIVRVGCTADGTATAKTESKKKVLDDQTKDVPRIFAEWRQEEGITW